MKLSKKIQKMESSGIRKIFEIASQNPKEWINLSIGQPHFQATAKLKKSAQKVILGNGNGYAPTQGILALRQEIARDLEVSRKIKADPQNIIITSGVSGAIFLLFASIFDPGDEVIVSDPFFVLYQQILNFLGVRIKYLDTYPDFQLDSQKLSGLISPKTKAIIINSPNNPTGAVYAKSEIEAIVEIARQNKLLIISDEIYAHFDYDQKFFSPASIYDKTILLNGFSKSHAVAGWRIGYALGPAEIIEAMNKLQQYTFVCAPSFAQQALIGNVKAIAKKEIARYKQKRDFVFQNLKNYYEMKKPQGAFYAFLKIPPSRKNFLEELSQKKLLVVPGEVFSQRKDHFRISFATSDTDLKKAVEILKELK